MVVLGLTIVILVAVQIEIVQIEDEFDGLKATNIVVFQQQLHPFFPSLN